MYGIGVMLVMLVLRVVIPVGLLLWIGEKIRQRQLPGSHPMPSRA